MYKQMTALIDEVLAELGLASGESVQTYSEKIIRSKLINAFDHFFKKRFWRHLTENSRHFLEVEGIPTTDLVGVLDPFDIEWVRLEPFERQDTLRFRPDHEAREWDSPFYRLLPGAHPLRNSRIIQVFPHNDGQEILVRARRYPLLVGDNPIVPFDSLCLVHFTAANILANDGMNVGAQQRHDTLMAQRYEDIVAQEAQYLHVYGRPSSRSFTVAEE